MNLLKKTLQFRSSGLRDDIALLALRAGVGSAMLFGHGLGKLMSFSEHSGAFPDPLGVGSTTSLGLTIFAEVACAALLIAGAFTRIAAFFLAFTMATAVIVIHAADPFQKKELALIYLVVFAFICVRGPGKYSLDRYIQ